MIDAFVCEALRTPIGRYGGALSSVRADDLAALPLRALCDRLPQLHRGHIDEVFLGCANQAGEDNRNVARMALLLAGLPESVPGVTINRLCASGLEAVAQAARGIKTGELELVIAGGVESMSRAPFVMAKAREAFGRDQTLEDTTMGWRFINAQMRELYGVDTMPETAENVAAEHGITRDAQDAFALRSQQRARAAQESGFFAEEIVAVETPGRRGESVRVDRDEHPRPDTTLAALAKLKAPFRAGGTVTAGTASGINDGACAMVIASAEAARANGLTPRARIVASCAVGVAPRLMGIGPVPAVQKVLSLASLTLDRIDVIELNEAFAAQSLAVLRALGLADDAPHVNPNGGAIALGHPLGMSGARLVITATHELLRRKGRYALCTMCVGVGQGAAMVLERVD